MAKSLTAVAVEKIKPAAARIEIPDGLLTGLYLVVQPSGAKSWAVRYRAAGKPRKLTLGPYPALDLGAARTAAQQALRGAQQGDDPAAQKVEAKRARRDDVEADRLGFGSNVRLYFARDARKNRSWLETARLLGLAPGDAGDSDPKTFKALPNGIVADWGSKSVAEIKRSQIIDRLDQIVDRGARIVANRTLAALRRFFNWCIERGLIEHSPCSSVKAPSPETSRDRVLSDDEIRWVWSAATEAAYPFGNVVKLLLLTAQRREEVAGMSEAELDGQTWTIPAARAKNDQLHQVPLSTAAQDVLAGLPKIAGHKRLLFTTTGETQVSGWSRAKDKIDASMLAIARKERGEPGLTIPAWTLHDLRRTAASGMARLGQPVHVVEKLLNHRSGTIRGVAAVYNRHAYWEERVKAADAWGRFVTSLVEERGSNVVSLLGRRP